MKMKWEELSKKIDKGIKIGTEVPKTDGRARSVTKNVGSRIYMRTGVQTRAEKYTTKEMLRYAYETIQSGEPFTSAGLKSNFPREYSQGSCVFSMTGGIFVLSGIAEYVRGIGYISVNEK
jgi:hypothetical protein